MIFQHTWEAVIEGRKTQTRRLVVPQTVQPMFYDLKNGTATPTEDGNTDGDWLWKNTVWHAKPCPKGKGYMGLPYTEARPKYRIGSTYAVQPGRGKPAIARIKITGIRREDVRNISDEDVKAEGLNHVIDFWRVWCHINDPRMIIWNIDQNGIWCANLFKGEHVPDENDIPSRNRRIMHAPGVRALHMELMKRPDDRYQAWVIEFEVVSP